MCGVWGCWYTCMLGVHVPICMCVYVFMHAYTPLCVQYVCMFVHVNTCMCVCVGGGG